MWQALFWGVVAGSSLLLGAVLGLAIRASHRVIAAVMALGSGVLISAVAFDLTEDAYATGGTAAVVIGLALGACMFYTGSRLVARAGAQHRKRSRGQTALSSAGASSGVLLAVGALLDGIPESAAIGLSLLEGEGVGIAMLADTMMPEAYEQGGPSVGLFTALGFTLAFLLDQAAM